MTQKIHPGAWGKLNRSKDGSTHFLALTAHCADVAAVAMRLLELPVWRSRFEKIAGRGLDVSDLARLGTLTFLHDLGKCAAGFWLKQFDRLMPDGRMDLSERQRCLAEMGGDLAECGHTSVILALLNPGIASQSFREHELVRALLAEPVHVNLLIASASHHGVPLNTGRVNLPDWTWRTVPDLGYDPLRAVGDLLEDAAANFPEALRSAPALPNTDEFQHAFCGLVSLADWIGSNQEDAFFPYDLAEPHARWPESRRRAEEVLRRMRIDCTEALADLAERRPSFGEVFKDADGNPWAPTPVQQAAAGEDLGPLVIIEDETGAGKTEAALWRFKTLFQAGKVDSLAFVLPTRVSAVALSGRIDAFLHSLFPDPDLRPNSVMAVPGYLVSDGLTGKRLPEFEVLWPDRHEEASAHRHWAAEHSKRYLAAAVAVGTVDQALLAGLQSRHAHLRGVALLRSLLVVDEVHASDIYMSRILEELLKRQIRSGGHALLLSATLGLSARQRLLQCDLGRRRRHLARQAAEIDGIDIPYPAISDQQRTRGFPPSSAGKTVEVELAPIAADADAIARRALSVAALGARVLVVRNTVADAIAVQRALEADGRESSVLFTCNGLPCPHHGRFAAPDRKLLDQCVETLFGKTSDAGPRILVGTQTLEQSLDIDADILLSDLCPMDVLLQRVGRLHRHAGRNRPDGFRRARLIVTTPAERDLAPFLRPRTGVNFGLGTVYRNLLSVEATWRALEFGTRMEIPEQNRRLVEQTTDFERLETLARELGPAWQEAWARLAGISGAQSQEADAVLLKWTEPFEAFAERQKAMTRLGEMPRLLQIPETVSPFGERLSELQIPHFLFPRDSDAEAVDSIVLNRPEDGFGFEIEGTRFTYSRYGLERPCEEHRTMIRREHAKAFE